MINFDIYYFLENSASYEQDSSMTATVDCHTGGKPSCSEKRPQKGIQ